MVSIGVPPTDAPDRRIAKLTALLDVGRALAQELDADSLLRVVMQKTTQILDADRSTLFLVDFATRELWSKVAQGVGVNEIRFPMHLGLAGHVAMTGEIINIPEAYDDPRFNRDVDRRTGYRTRTILCMPVKEADGTILGVIQVLNKRGGIFDAEDEETLAILSSQTAVALRNARLLDELRRRMKRTEILLDVMRTLSGNLDLEPLLATIMAKTTQAMDADRSTLFLVDYRTRELWSKVAQGAEVNEIRFPMHLGLAGHVAMTGETINIPEAYDDPRFNRDVDRRTGYRTRTILCAPVRDETGRIIGVTQILNKRQGVFNTEDEDLLGALSAQAAIALKNAQLFQQVSFMKNYNESILRSMATAVITLQPDGVVSTVNPAAVRVFGLQSLDWFGLVVDQILNASQNVALVEAVRRAVATGAEYTGYDLKYTTLAGDLVSLNVNVLPLRDNKGQALGFVLVADDITQEQRLMSTLCRYVAREVAEKVLAQRDQQALGGIKQRVTVLFSDIRSYTTITERATAEEVVALLNDYFSRMVKEVFRFEGTLDKYIGDAIMAVFGAPIAHDDDPLRAVLAAVAMRRGLWRFNEERMAAGEVPIEIGIGICNGEAVSGNIGSMDRMDYTVIGDAVNVASRLEGLTKNYPCKILFNEGVYDFVQGVIPCIELGLDHVKGREEAVRIFGISDDWIRSDTDDLLASVQLSAVSSQQDDAASPTPGG
ncbi:MAG: GAF domain-containing protein [Chloroflexi bacterium]|nr:GAF domain-containing protein [Chloroflexota bacterium]